MEKVSNESKQYSYIEQSYRSIFIDYLTSTTTHGLRCIGDAYTTPNRIFWIINFVFALSWMLYFLISSGQEYRAYPTQMDIEIRDEYRMIFPAVTICSASPYRADKMNASLMAYAERTGINLTNDFIEAYIELLVVDLFNRNETNELIDIGFRLSDMLIDCSFSGIDCTSNFTHSLSSVFGNCYTFNWKSATNNLYIIRNTSLYSAPFEGLSLDFYIPRESNYPLSYVDEGLILLLNENDEFPLVLKNGIRLQPGLSHTISFTKNERNLLSKPYTNCTSSVGPELLDISETAFGKDFGGQITYSENVCQESCLKSLTAAACSCILPSPFFQRNVWYSPEKILRPANTCVPFSIEESCAALNLRGIKASNEYLKTWCPQCTPQCKTISFQTMLSSLSAPSSKQKSILINRFLNNESSFSSILLPNDFALQSDKYLTNNYLKVLITWSNQYATVYNQKAKISIADTFAAIGGQTGIWIGLSILGFIEFCEVIFKFLIKFITLAKRQEVVKSNFVTTTQTVTF